MIKYPSDLQEQLLVSLARVERPAGAPPYSGRQLWSWLYRIPNCYGLFIWPAYAAGCSDSHIQTALRRAAEELIKVKPDMSLDAVSNASQDTAREAGIVVSMRDLSQARNELWRELNRGGIDPDGPQGPLRNLDYAIEELGKWVERRLKVRL